MNEGKLHLLLSTLGVGEEWLNAGCCVSNGDIGELAATVLTLRICIEQVRIVSQINRKSTRRRTPTANATLSAIFPATSTLYKITSDRTTTTTATTATTDVKSTRQNDHTKRQSPTDCSRRTDFQRATLSCFGPNAGAASLTIQDHHCHHKHRVESKFTTGDECSQSRCPADEF